MSLKLCKGALRALSIVQNANKRCLNSTHATVCIRFSHHQSNRRCSSAALATPDCDGQEKLYSQKIRDIVDQISQLSLLEVADLNEYLKKTLRITDAPVMAAAAAVPAAGGGAQAEEEEAQSKFVQTEFTVSLTAFDDSKKIALIKALKGIIDGMNLVQAKKFVESIPQVVKADVSKEDAEKLQKELEAVGASVVIE